MKVVEMVKKALLCCQRDSWEQGFAAQSLYEAGDTETFVMLAFDAVARQHEDGRLGMTGDLSLITDPAANGEPVWRAFEHTNNEYYRNGAEKMLQYLMMYGRRTPDGVLFHSAESVYPGFSADQFWVKTCYSLPPFLALMDEFTEATKQYGGYYNILCDDDTGLLYHSYDYKQGVRIKQKLWATGNGLAMLGAARLMTEAIKKHESQVANDLQSAGIALLEAMLKFQHSDGRFHNILDNDQTFLDGASAMMVAAFIYRGIYEGWLNEKYKKKADLIRETMTDYIDGDGFLHGVCGPSDFEKEGTSSVAQSAFIMMDAWAKKVVV
ncbi:MAG: glycoside hydrolase family 88 protein [Oscillospiraceae bacterium]|jgi:rhamnogalacturonyl hydrolase YesR|nr:glycoside hydrolase family 88 protein [Oscillospiraceae bacterium]